MRPLVGACFEFNESSSGRTLYEYRFCPFKVILFIVLFSTHNAAQVLPSSDSTYTRNVMPRSFLCDQNVTQREAERPAEQFVLGVWGELSEDHSLLSQVYTDGDACGNITRTTQVTVECGARDFRVGNVSF